MRCVSFVFLLALPFTAWSDSLNTSYFIRMETATGGVFETTSRRVLQPGEFVEDTARDWGISFSLAPAASVEGFEISIRVLEKVRQNDGIHWEERAHSVAIGKYGKPLELMLETETVKLDSSFFVSVIP